MKNLSLAAKAAGAASLALLLTTSAFADDRHQDQTFRRDDRGDRGRAESRDNRGYGYRENERVNLSGRITSFNRENDGYRVNLDRGPAFWVPESYYRRHAHDWRVGVSITLGGVFRGGSVYVDDDGYYGGPAGYYGDGYVRGIVDRVDFRRDSILVRDDRSGRIIDVDLRGDRYGRLNIDDFRRGDFVELSGNWIRGDVFAADRIDNVRGRY